MVPHDLRRGQLSVEQDLMRVDALCDPERPAPPHRGDPEAEYASVSSDSTESGRAARSRALPFSLRTPKLIGGRQKKARRAGGITSQLKKLLTSLGHRRGWHPVAARSPRGPRPKPCACVAGA